LLSLLFRHCSLHFRYLSLLLGIPIEPRCEHGENTHNHKRNISDPRPLALRIRGLLQRLFGFVQGRLALGTCAAAIASSCLRCALDRASASLHSRG